MHQERQSHLNPSSPRAVNNPLEGHPEPKLGIAWGFIYGYLGEALHEFMPELRKLGAGATKINIFWAQLEPDEGSFDWSAVDAFTDQLMSGARAVVSVFSSSTWATRRSTRLLPASPAKTSERYARFIEALVLRCRGKVRYWQNGTEPNNPVFWSGTREDFVNELRLFHQVLKMIDPEAVVLPGGYDGLFNPPGLFAYPDQQRGLDFFDYLFAQGADCFDMFDLHLYGDPYTIPWRVEHIRRMMQAHGIDKPMICSEYNGPGFFEFPANLPHVGAITKWSDSWQTGHFGGLRLGPVCGYGFAAAADSDVYAGLLTRTRNKN